MQQLGKLSEEEAEKASKVTNNFITTFVTGLGSLFKGLGFLGVVLVIVLLFTAAEYVILGAAVGVLAGIVYIFFRIGKNCKLLGDATVWLDILGSLVSLVLSLLMLMADPAGDEFYYFAAIVCIVGVGLTAALSMRRYNELVTRPLPHFFDRKAGGDY